MQQFPQNKQQDAPLFDANAHLRHYIHVVMERRWLALAAFLLVLVLTGVYLAQATRIYMASARIQINRDTDNPLNSKDVAGDARFEMDYLQTQYKNLQNRTLIDEV